MSQLRGPFSGDVKTPPSPTAGGSGNKFDVSELNQSEDTSVLKTEFYADCPELKGSPAALATTHGTATETIGKTPNFNK